MQSQDLKKYKLPDKPGVYFFLKGKKILYIGKATSLQDRVRSYFSKDLIATRGPSILDMVVQTDKVKWQEADSVLEALILEAELIKKHLPKYNVKEKDDKSWNYVCITREKIPKVIIKRGKELREAKQNSLPPSLLGVPSGTHGRNNFVLPLSAIFGPYTNGGQLKEAMKIIRRIFPFIDGESSKKNNAEFYRQLGLTPEGLKEYKENIRNLKLFFQGKKKKIIRNLKKEMGEFAKKREFEKAGEIKNKIFALEHINDVALIKQEVSSTNTFARSSDLLAPSPRGSARPSQKYLSTLSRIEAYDIAHMSGKNMVGVMTVIENGEIAKKEYKKFIIRTQSGSNDTGALEEVLARRFRHLEWGLPSLVVVDGSLGQINVAKKVLLRYNFKIPVVGVVKDEHHKARAIEGEENLVRANKKYILLGNSESHRFAIKFYREKSRKNMLK
jgi:excinuclease UvrABC nuclease subunit